ncbi:MAG TPA: hypothetical protein PKH43_07735 [Saprospiraceae bacterium]|nr:hypothetical protein [Saprospiraceae bacterium]
MMFKNIIFIGGLALLAACNGSSNSSSAGQLASNTGQKPEIRILKNYFLLNSVEIKERQCWLIDNPASFEQTFGMGKTLNNDIINPNFDSSIVAAIAVPPANRLTDIRVSELKITGDTAYVHFVIVEGADELTWTSQPLLLFSFPRMAGLKTVTFVQNKVPVSSYPVPAPAGASNPGNGSTIMPNYFFKENVVKSGNIYCTVIGSQAEFDAALIAPNSTTFVSPDFSKEIVVAIALPQTQKATELRFESAAIENGDMKVLFTQKEGAEQSVSVKPTGIVDVQRGDAKQVTFYLDGKIIKTVPVPALPQ